MLFMHNTENEIFQLQLQIQKEKSKVKDAIRNGAIFDDVKNITLVIKEMEKTLESLRNKLHGDGIERSSL